MTKQYQTTCDIDNCGKPAPYSIYKTDKDGKHWVNVCPYHDTEIAGENLKRVGGYLK